MARGDKKLEHLQAVRLFSACTKSELAQIGRASDEIDVPDGRVLCEEGTPGHEFFLILEGTATVSKHGVDVAELGPGRYFGELALLDKGPRTATVTAKGAATLLVLGQREFSGVLDEVPGIAHKLLTGLATRLREEEASQSVD